MFFHVASPSQRIKRNPVSTRHSDSVPPRNNTELAKVGLVGRYSADIVYGQSRVLAAWDELIFPNGSRIALRGMSAADGQGQSGIEDQVNNHFWRTWSSALLVSLLGVAAQQSQPQNQGVFNTPSGTAQASAAAVNSLSDVSSKILQKSLNISPTLQVRPGMAFNVMVNRSITLAPYR
jgi:type IV secretory pathway VirB10-like protein